MRLFSAYISMHAARKADSLFETEHVAKEIEKDGQNMISLVKKESEDTALLDEAERSARITDISEIEKKEIHDITELVETTFTVIRDSILLMHSQLDELKELMRQDEYLKSSGFPIEVADELEEMLKKEIEKIVGHLREMTDMKNESDNTA